MTEPVQIIGSYLSPYVRKVLVFLHCKKIAYQIDPIVPFFGDERFSKLSPVWRIPVPLDDRVTLCDSSVICQYLEERYPDPSLYPRDIADRARARWPKTARFVARVLAHDAFAHLAPFEERMIRTPIAEHRSVVAEMGAPILAETYGTSAPRRGVMRLG